MNTRLPGFLILVICLLGLAFVYGYPHIWQLLPQGSHIWRQADCLAMAQNYRQFHFPFLQPGTYNLQSDDGRVAGEFPLFYYVASCFSNTAMTLRILHTLLFMAGLLSTYLIAFHFLRRQLLSILCTLLLFTSPLLVFYGNNFLSDVPALSASFIGWAIFLAVYQKRQLGWIIPALCFFTLGSLLKASQAINFCIVFLLLFNTGIPQTKAKLMLSSLFCVPVLLWYYYARSYNNFYHDSYYCLHITPVWSLSYHDIGLGIWRMTVALSKNYFWRPTSLLLIVSVYLLLKYRKKLEKDLRRIILSSFLLTLLYILLFYQKMIGHEYYYTVFYVFVLFALIGVLKIYNLFHADNIFSHLLLFLLLIPNILFCRHFVAEKLRDSFSNGYLASSDMQDFLITHNVTYNKTILSLPDDSPNKSLCLLKRKGFTEFNGYSSVLIEQKSDFLLLGNDMWKKDKLLSSWLKDSIGNFHGYTLYKLK